MSESAGPDSSGEKPPAKHRGPVAWMARNRVAANLLMLFLLLGGLLTLPRLNKEVFPQTALDVVTVRVPYPGASPQEVEQGVILAVEEAVRGLEGVKGVQAVADEGLGIVNVELLLSASRNEMLDDVKSAVGRITSFPEDVEEPTISLASNRRQVISLVYAGDVQETSLRQLAEGARSDLLDDPNITFVELSGTRPREVAIEVPRDALRRYGLTLQDIQRRVRASSIDLPAGDLETENGEIVVRTTEREESAAGFEEILLISEPDGTQVRLGDIATIRDGFRDVDQRVLYNGKPAIRVDVFRVGNETPLQVASAVHDFVDRERSQLPPTVSVHTWNDMSEIYEDRMSLLMRNAYIGLGIVLLILGLFLEPRLAFWVTLGIPISFLGAILLIPATGVTINLISLFAFIVTLGLVVDDAIVVGEAIYRRRQQGEDYFKAAIRGAHEVAQPVLFSITTTCIAFTPMLFVPGVAGEFFRNIPIVVILVLLASLVESLLILPAHLSHKMPRLLELVLTPFLWLMSLFRAGKISAWLDRIIERRYVPLVRGAMRWRYATVAAGLLLLSVVVGLRIGGHLDMTFLPQIEDDQVRVRLEMPVGTPFDVTKGRQQELVEAARRVVEGLDEEGILEGIYSEVGKLRRRSGTSTSPAQTGSHVASVTVDLVPAGQREIRSSEFMERWREEVGSLPASETVAYSYSAGATEGPPINMELTHPDVEQLELAAAELAKELSTYQHVRDVDDGFSPGKERIDVRLTPEGRAEGFTDAMLARELRAALFGAEAQRFQRGRDEVRVYVRLPEEQRQSLEDLEQWVLQTPRGGEMSLSRAASLEWDRAFTHIERTDLKRTVNVTAYLQGDLTANEVSGDLQKSFLPKLKKRYPALRAAPGGQQQMQQDSLSSLASGFAIAVLAMFALLAVAFRSYFQPIIVLFAIPFGMIGAVAGHLLLGFSLSLMSMFGLVALSGVVVNDSLLMVAAINDARQREASLLKAAVTGAGRRFRPILMTSLTTFGGLAPMMFETSVQARFLIPMAISLGFGILFATLILLLLVPSLYLIVEDVTSGVRRTADRLLPKDQQAADS